MKSLTLLLLAVVFVGAAHPKQIRISVNGQSLISRAPNAATISLSIVTTDDVAENATSDNNRRYEALRNALHALAIFDSSVRTTGFSVNYVPPNPSLPPRERPRHEYTVSRQIDVDVAQLDAIGKVIDGAVSAGVTDVGGVTFRLSNPRSVYAQALGAAMLDAQQQARAIAAAARMHIVSIEEVTSGFTPLNDLVPAGTTADVYSVRTPTQIRPSNVQISANVTVWYRIAP